MNERDFIYWLQGMLENLDGDTLDKKKLQSVKDHLKLVMTKVTPAYPSISTTFGYPPFNPVTDTQTIIC